MKKKRNILEKLKRPRKTWLVALYLATILVGAASVFLALKGEDGTLLRIASYPVYALAALLLGYSVYTVVIYAPKMKSASTEIMRKNAFLANAIDRYDFRTAIFSLGSFAINVAFALFNLYGAFKYKLVWYACIATYYFILIILRGGILLADRKSKQRSNGDQVAYARRKWKIYLAGGIILIQLEIAMAVAVTQMMFSERPTSKGEIMTIANSAYTFYKMTMAIYNLLKARRFNDPVVQALRNVNFADACMSVASLTVAMLSTFGDFGGARIFEAVVGFAACAAIMVMAIRMIVLGAVFMKRMRKHTNERQ